MSDFADFIREKGVVGLATGIIIGIAVTGVVDTLVDGVINPLVGLGLGKFKTLDAATFQFYSATISWGAFVSALIDFVIIAAVIYFGFKLLKLDKLDRPKGKKK